MAELTPQEKGRRYETEFEKRTNAKKVPASGALPFWKLDNKNSKFLFSLKHTDKDQFILKKSDIQEMLNAVYGMGGIGGSHIPTMVLSIDGIEVSVLLTEDFFDLVENPPVVEFKSDKNAKKREGANTPSLLKD